MFFANLITVKNLSDLQSDRVKAITHPDDDTDLGIEEKQILLGVTASLAIENILKEAWEKKRQVFLVGATGKVKERLQKMKLLRLLPPDNRFSERLPALQQAISYIESQNKITDQPIVTLENSDLN